MASELPSDVMEMFFDTETLITPERIENIKLNLMSRDPASMISAVSWIKKSLASASDSKRECLIEALIENDALTYLCENIACSSGFLYMSMLEIVRKLISNKNFYRKNFAKLASNSIIRASFVIVRKMESHEETLTSVVITLYKLLNGASEAQVCLDSVYHLDQMVAFLERLDPKRSTNYHLRLNAAEILCLIMSNIKFPIKEGISSSLSKAFRESMLSMGGTVLDLGEANEDEFIQFPLEIICSACALGIRFCKELECEDFAKEITCIMIDTVIPQFKRIKFEREVYKRCLKNLITCLDEILKLKNGDKELANVLAAHGYLKFFLEIPVPRKSVSSLVSQIIAKLSEDDFARSDSPEGLVKFQNRINEEILALPSDADIATILRVNLSVSDGFLILLYYHSHKAHEYDLVLLHTMVFKLMGMMISTEVESDLVVKAAWFLFMVSSKDSQTDCVTFRHAVINLVQLLHRHDLRKCYTHNRVLLDCSLSCKGFLVEFQHEIVRLWLEFDGEIEPLLESLQTELIDDCLMNTIETSSGKCVKRTLEVLAELKSNKQRWARIRERVWKRLPEALALCSVNTAVNIKELLKIVQGTKPEEINLEIYKQSAATLVTILENQNLGNHLKILLLKYVNTLLEVALERNSPTVVESCVKHAQLFEILRDKGLARESWPLSSCCLNLMMNILESQTKFKLQASESDVVTIEPLKILVLLARSDYELSSAAVRLLIILLNREKTFIISVALNDFESAEAADEATSAWYKMLHQLLFKKQMEDWHLIYRCLISVLDFCEEIELDKTLRYLCDYSSTYDLVRWTMDHEYRNPIFYNFLDTWLQYAHKYRSLNLVLEEHLSAFDNLAIGPSEFEEILNTITNFKSKV